MELSVYTNSTLKDFISSRPKELKFGEKVKTLTPSSSIYEQLKDLDVDYVIFGISESIGVWANHGKLGTEKTWRVVLKYLLNTQHNPFVAPEKILILGEIHAEMHQNKLEHLDASKKKDLKKARKWVGKIDSVVNQTVYQIIKAGKIPIVIGGGHNNAYGILKGTALALNSAINAVNLDAHTDFRPEEGRHSGNGFSYAYAEGFLKSYFMLGIHENYLLENNYNVFKKIKSINYLSFDSIIRQDVSFEEGLNQALEAVNKYAFGIELDCDAISNVNSSAKTPSGFTVNEARRYVTFMANHLNAKYLHVCEAISTAENEQSIGKLISYLILDFIKAHEARNKSV